MALTRLECEPARRNAEAPRNLGRAPTPDQSRAAGTLRDGEKEKTPVFGNWSACRRREKMPET
jgi:hypothetical protein